MPEYGIAQRCDGIVYGWCLQKGQSSIGSRSTSGFVTREGVYRIMCRIESMDVGEAAHYIELWLPWLQVSVFSNWISIRCQGAVGTAGCSDAENFVDLWKARELWGC